MIEPTSVGWTGSTSASVPRSPTSPLASSRIGSWRAPSTSSRSHAIYRWGGKIYDAQQPPIDLRTPASFVLEVLAWADRDQTDGIPRVFALPISGDHSGYLQWAYAEKHEICRFSNVSN